MGDAEGAAQALERLVEQVPQDAAGLRALARLQVSQGDMNALEKTAEQLRAARPDDPAGYYIKGLVLREGGDLEAGLVQFETALQKDPAAAEPLVALTQTHLALGQGDDAVTRLQQVLEANPANALAANLLAEVYLSTGQVEKAREQYRNAIDRSPASPLAYQGLSQIQLSDSDPEGALATLRSGLDATQRDDMLVLSLAILSQQLGHFDEAVAAYEEAIQRSPANDAAENNLAMLLADHRFNDPDSLGRARELTARFETSERAAYLDTAGWVRYRRGEYQQAVELLEKAIEIEGATPERQYHLGMAYLKTGRFDEGKALVTSAIESGSSFTGIDDARAALESH
jgi:tetratricopeptide (TPR) repeat protein